MSILRKHTTIRKAKKADPEKVVITKTYISEKDHLFPEKWQKANEILKEANFDPDKWDTI